MQSGPRQSGKTTLLRHRFRETHRYVTESLVGRTAMLRLLPLSYREISKTPQAAFPWERGPSPKRHRHAFGPLWKRDVRSLRQFGDLTQFQAFLRALAARSAQLLNVTDLARDLGLAVNTMKAWISVLEATYQVIILRPYFRNVGKRLVKTPKVYLQTWAPCATWRG